MTESQAHGFTWEKTVKNVYGTNIKASYTRKHDVDANENTINHCAISIKATGSKSVDMGDVKRVHDTLQQEEIHMVVIQYTQDDATGEKVLSAVLEVDLTGGCDLAFGELTRQEITEFCELIKKIPKGRATDEMKKTYLTRLAELNSKTGAIHLRPKVDSAKQRRVQCSFVNINEFCEKYPERLLSKNTEGILHGTQIPVRIKSERRQRKKKESRQDTH